VPAFADPGGQMLSPAHRCQAPTSVDKCNIAQKNLKLSGNEYLKQGPLLTFVVTVDLTKNAQYQFPIRNMDP
jgi:hypothetical protein